jgi:hypothetical protein
MDSDSRQSTSLSPLVPTVLRQNVSHITSRAAESRALALDIDPRTALPRGCGNLHADGTPRAKL